MNHQKIYNNIIEKRKFNPPQGYSEVHHIKPRCMGGADNKSNLVRLTPKEHFICHFLLVKIHKNTEFFSKLVHAFYCMRANPKKDCVRYLNAKLYEKYSTAFSAVISESQSGQGNSQFGTRWISNKALRKSIKIKKEEQIPRGWFAGRIVNWDKYYDRLTVKVSLHQLEKSAEAFKLWNIFKQSGLSAKEFANSEYYPYSKVSLLKTFKKYIPEFSTVNTHGSALHKNITRYM